jgi:hypothetical protein
MTGYSEKAVSESVGTSPAYEPPTNRTEPTATSQKPALVRDAIGSAKKSALQSLNQTEGRNVLYVGLSSGRVGSP